MRFFPTRASLACRVRRGVAIGLVMVSGPAVSQALLSLGVSRSPLSLPLYVAEAEGFFTEAGLRVRVRDCTAGDRCLRLVLEGEVDVATAGDTPIMFNAFTSADFVVIGTIASTTDDLKLLVRQEAGIAVPRQLEGRRIGMVPGSSSQYFLDSFLLTHGIEPRLVTAVAMQPEDMPEALRSGRVDGVATWEPDGYRLAGAFPAGMRQMPAESVYNVTSNLVAGRRLVGPRDADLARLLGALMQAVQFIREQPERAKAILRRRLGVDDGFVRWVWPQQVYRLSLDQSLLKTLESEARWAIREGHVARRTPPNFLRYLHSAPLMAVSPAAVGIHR